MKTTLTTILLAYSLMSVPAFAKPQHTHHVHHKHTRHVAKFTNLSQLKSRAVLIFDEGNQHLLYDKNTEKVMPIASITKLMTAMVVLDANLPLDEAVPVVEDDTTIHRSKSKLKIGMRFTRGELLQLALMSSENRAARALAESYPGGVESFVQAMNLKAVALGMDNTAFFDPTGLDKYNVSTAQDLVKMVAAASTYPTIHEYTTASTHQITNLGTRKPMNFHNTNPLVSTSDWDINLSKTGYIREAGRCLVMQTTINGVPVIIILLDSKGKHTRITDAKNIKAWLIKQNIVGAPIMSITPTMPVTPVILPQITSEPAAAPNVSEILNDSYID